MECRSIEICVGDMPELASAPIDPEWILEGAPEARSNWWSTGTDGTNSNFVWDCTKGRFRWYFACDETVQIIAGEVEVSAAGVPATMLRAGDAALFRAGTWAEWNVPQYVRKHAALASTLPRPLRFQVACGRRAKTLLRRALKREAAALPVFAE